ncbi:MAG: thioesterase [Bacteroidetes bacterium]|nr:thioesterase [Bacteroidota bacterium]
MMSPFESEEYVLNSEDVDAGKNLTVTAFCAYMQNLAGRAAEKRGYGYTFMLKNNLVWVLVRISGKIKALASWNDRVKLLTWVKGIEKLKSDRHFVLYDKDENELACAITEWSIIAFVKRRPQVIDKLIDSAGALADKSADAAAPSKIPPLINPSPAGDRKIVFSDIDMNGHVSNIKYAEWFLDTYDYEHLGNNYIEEFEMNFLSECRFGESVRIFRQEDGNTHYGSVVRDADKREVFRIKLNWKKL